jgi:hypothetical protein
MPCDTKRDASGQITGFVCGRSRRNCQWCSRASTTLCDFPTQDGTCDARMCDQHSRRVAKDTDFCPTHRDKVPR